MASLQLDRVEAGRGLGGAGGGGGGGEGDAVVRDRQAQLSSFVAPASRCEARARVDARSNGRQARLAGPLSTFRARRGASGPAGGPDQVGAAAVVGGPDGGRGAGGGAVRSSSDHRAPTPTP